MLIGIDVDAAGAGVAGLAEAEGEQLVMEVLRKERERERGDGVIMEADACWRELRLQYIRNGRADGKRRKGQRGGEDRVNTGE